MSLYFDILDLIKLFNKADFMKASLNMKKGSLFDGAFSIVKKLQGQGHQAYLVGGCVRDSLLGRELHDIDIVTSALPESVMEIFPHNHPIGEAFGIITVPENGHCYEIATLREERGYADGRHPDEIFYADEPLLDAKRRDFTVNGMFYDPVNDVLLDYFNGREDLCNGILRTIGSAHERFSEDYLRILRAVRFAVKLGFEIAPETLVAAAELKHNLKSLSVERIREEFNKILTGPAPSRAFRLMLDTGILEETVPELAALSGVSQPKKHHPEGDVFTHTMLMLDHMAFPSVALGWSILLHDIAKPCTLSLDEEGTEHFYGHEHQGAEMTLGILERLKFPKDSIDKISSAVRNHMRFAHVHDMKTAKWKRLMADPNFPLELELHRIDCVSCHGKLDNYLLLLDRAIESGNRIELPKAFLSGRDLIALGLNPGPLMGQMLKELLDLQLEGKIQCADEALEYAVKLIAEHKQ